MKPKTLRQYQASPDYHTHWKFTGAKHTRYGATYHFDISIAPIRNGKLLFSKTQHVHVKIGPSTVHLYEHARSRLNDVVIGYSLRPLLSHALTCHVKP